jgi:hypothetical protein
VYFSHQSIVGNAGNYDDFEKTSGPEAIFVFKTLPLKSQMIFFGVLAVNAAGVESEGFITEASVTVPAAQPASASSASKEPAASSASSSVSAMPQNQNTTSTAESMSLMSVEALSSTGVLVTFSKKIHTSSTLTPEFFLLTDSGGLILKITEVIVEQKTLLLKTETQIPHRSYLFGLLNVITAEDGTSATPSTSQMTFQGFKETAMATSTPTSQQATVVTEPSPIYGKAPVSNVFDPTNLNLVALPRKDGTYDIRATWNPAQDAKTYGLYTSINDGKFTQNGQVPVGQTSVLYRQVKPGTFGLRLTTQTDGGLESRGIERAVNLPSTGLGLLGILGIAGATAGARFRRRKKTV